jgi:hypothetical protein
MLISLVDSRQQDRAREKLEKELVVLQGADTRRKEGADVG